ncbi:MAG: Flp pilus assembly complex ATPase component TadA [Candidatus Hydrogenedens sp.]|jgi:type II secretory ATPase GspE/PulE/Tfp pilus assembly ATPase PilB-like protein|nr:Flp pilus assembly complex ATPase component TadA [Candidatus Hydrogenedens sp.]
MAIQVTDEHLLTVVTARLAHHYGVMPLAVEDSCCQIASPTPDDLVMRDELSRLLGMPVALSYATEEDIESAQKKWYGIGADTMEQLSSSREEADFISAGAVAEEVGDAGLPPSIIKFVNQLLTEAVHSRATDIHIEPFADRCRVRTRVDGILYELPAPATLSQFQSEIVSRIKIMAGLNIAETRLPQDGRIPIRIGGNEIDLRVSIVPIQHGESVNIRILQARQSLLSLEALGFSQKDRDLFERQTLKTHGIVLVTGPTGSGKTTTLYAALDRINDATRKIITIEDPVEYEMEGICQMQVKTHIGFTFSTGLRSILRHDPDVILVGEIRDLETAELAMRSALTGHLVFSTLHTNDAPSSITRLQDLGIDSYLICSSVECVIAQRLVRRICPHCREEQPIDSELIGRSGLSEETLSTFHFYKGAGCAECRNAGYLGRQAIAEAFAMDEEMRRLIMDGAPANILRDRAVLQGMTGLWEDGLQKVSTGETTLEELLRVTQS